MAKLKYIVVGLALSVFLVGCNDMTSFFDYNVFTQMGLTTPTVTKTYPTASTQTTQQQQATLDELGLDLSSPTYVAALESDPVALKAVEDYLLAVYTQQPVTSTNEPVIQQASVMSANLNLDTTGGTELVANIVSTLFSSTTKALTLGSATTATDLVNQILPEGITETEFVALVQGLIAANDAYIALAATLVSTDLAADLEKLGINMGDVAQKALVSYAVSSIVNFWGGSAANLWAYLHGSTAASAQPSGDFSSILASTAAGYIRIQLLFQVAGLDLTNYL